jgi:DNA-binding XRE family transcriptional regulator
METRSPFARLHLYYRQRAEMTQNDLQEAVQVSVQLLAAIERGALLPKRDLVVKLADAFHLTDRERDNFLSEYDREKGQTLLKRTSADANTTEVLEPPTGESGATERLQTIFISYRRDDSASGHAGRLCADLTQRYGSSKVFMDIDIEAGADFVNRLGEAVGSCAVLLAVIGRYWLTATDVSTGKRRLDNPEDWVRVEIATALERNVRVIPVLFHRADMPNADDLPENLKPLARRQAHEITDSRWNYDVGKLFEVLDKICEPRT